MEMSKNAEQSSDSLEAEQAYWDSLPLREQIALLEWRRRQAEKGADITPR